MSTPHPAPPPPPPEIRELLDSSFGDGPPPAPMNTHIDAGRAALRRRRTLTAVFATTAVAGVALLAALVGGPSAPTEIAPAGQPSASAADDCPDCVEMTGEASEPRKARPKDFGFEAVGLAPDGRVVTARGVTITQRVPNPMGYTDPDASLGVAYERDGESTWALLTRERNPDGTVTAGTSSDPAGTSFPSLELWLDDMVALQNGDEAPLQFVRFAGDGTETLRPLDGVELIRQSADIDLGAGFAGPDDPTAVAEVRVAGERWYVLARTIGRGAPQYLPTAASIGGETLDDFLAYASDRYAEGGGGLR